MDFSRIARTLFLPETANVAGKMLEDASHLPRGLAPIAQAGEAAAKPLFKFGNLMPDKLPPGSRAVRTFTTDIIDGESVPFPAVKIVPQGTAVAKAYETKGSLFTVVHTSGRGSGFLIDDAGLIATADHVVEKSPTNMSVHIGAETIPATVVGRDIAADVALLKLSSIDSALKPLTLGSARDLEPGTRAYLMARLRGVPVVSEGRILNLKAETSAPGRNGHLLDGDPASVARLTYTNESVPGTSGGYLLVNDRVVGVHTHGSAARDAAASGTAIDHIKALMDRVSKEKSTVGWLEMKSESNWARIWSNRRGVQTFQGVTPREVSVRVPMPIETP